ncbi:MAG: single-stranded-DNA-specific exonuclease RecJ [Acidobacteriota bacterium]
MNAGPAVVWSRAEVPAATPALIAAGIAPRTAELLARRGVADADGAQAFLEPSLDQLHDPAGLHGLDGALDRLERARDAGEKVAIVGDYDVDGVSGTALLIAGLGSRGVDATPFLPHRVRDGYGLQPRQVDRAREAGCSLIVTVDCGTTSGPAARHALALGLDLIVTDHHLPGEAGDALPEGVIEVNPRRDACPYPFAELSGAGLAYKLVAAFAHRVGRPIDDERLLRIACLGTIADLVPLRGENRVIAALGLKALDATTSRGLRALFRVARLAPPITAEDIGFQLGPRLNAPGRLDSAEPSLELLLTRDDSRAERLARDLDARNRERRTWERRVTDEALELFSRRSPLPPVLVGWSSGWHRGVVGVAAGRVARELHRPTLLLAEENDTAVGSGRSVEGVSLHGLVVPFADELERFGGHAQAIGLTITRDRLEELQAFLEATALDLEAQLATRRLDYELETTPTELAGGLAAELARLEPFGAGNPRPLIRLRGPLRTVGEPRRFGNGHLEIQVAAVAEATAGDRIDRRDRVTMLGWGWAPRAERLHGPFEALGHLERDRRRNRPVFRLVDCRPVEDPAPATPA